MRDFRFAIAALAFIIAVPPTAGAQTKEPIRLGIGIDAAYVPMYLAKQKKLFEKHGVNVELMQFTQGGEALDAVVAGRNPMGSAAEPTTMIRAARADIKALAIFGQSPTYIKLVVKPEISDPKQIRKIGVVPGTVSEYTTALMLKKYAIDPKSIEMVKLGPPEAPALLARGDIDGYFMWEPWPTNGIKLGAKPLLTNGDVGYVDNLWLSADGAWLSGHQAEVKAILAALAEGCAIFRADLAAAAAAVQAEAKIPADTALGMLKDRECVVRDFTDADLQSYDRIADFLIDRKIIPAKVDLGKLLQRGFYTGK